MNVGAEDRHQHRQLYTREDVTQIVSNRLKQDREKRGITVLLRERVALKKRILELETTNELLRKEVEFLRYQAWLHDYGP